MTDDRPAEPTASTSGSVTVVAEIRCSACTGNRGGALIGVVFTNGDREWLVMNAQVRKTSITPKLAPYQEPSLKVLVYGGRSRPPITLTAELDWMRDHWPCVVWDLERPEQIDPDDRWPLASVSCPRCAPTGHESSWFLDYRKIGSRLKRGTVVKLLAADVCADGDHGPISDRDLGYSRPLPPGILRQTFSERLDVDTIGDSE